MDRRSLFGVSSGAGWVNKSATVTRSGDVYLVEGCIEGRPASILVHPSTDPTVTAIRKALAAVAAVAAEANGT